jgi:hypothetical protein
MMETNEMSFHMVKIYLFLQREPGWHTARKVAAGAGVAPRTASRHLLQFATLMIVDREELFPAHQYRLSALAAKRNSSFLQRLEQAREIFGLPTTTGGGNRSRS